MNLMPAKKNPFKNGTIEEVLETEQDSFVIQIGNDFYSKDGSYVFTAVQANKHYNTLVSNILWTLENGNEKQKKSAKKCLLRLYILPLRIQ